MFTKISKYIYTITPAFLHTTFTRESFVIYTRNIQWITAWKVLTTIFSLITTMLVARLLGPEQFGTLSYIISIAGLFAVLGNLGIGYIVYEEMVKNKEDRATILGSSIALTLATGFVAFLVTVLYLLFSHDSFYIKSLILLMSCSLFTAPLSYLHIDFLKDKEGKYVAITQTITTITGGILKILSVFIFSSLYLFIIVLVLENIFAGAIYLYQIKYIKKRSINFRISKERMISFFYAAIPLTALSAFNEIYYRIDQVLLKNMVNLSAVGLYATAVRLTEIWYIVPNILTASLFPALAHASLQKTDTAYTQRFKIFLGILIGISFLIILFTVIFGKELIVFIYGQEFLGASLLLSVYITSLPGTFISLLLMQDMFLKKTKWKMVIFSACTASINIFTCLILIPVYGALGAAIATTISYNLTPLIYYGIKYLRGTTSIV